MLEFLDGAKTFLSGAVLIGAGVAGMVFGVVDPSTGIMLVGNGLGVWGLGHKLEKLTTAVKEKEIVIHVPKAD